MDILPLVASSYLQTPEAGLSGFALEYDAARLIAQGLGANLQKLGHLVQVKGETARLLFVAERAEHLCAKIGNSITTTRKLKQPLQASYLPQIEEEMEEVPAVNVTDVSQCGATVLDRVHQAMLLFGSGRADALKRFLVEDGVGRSSVFWSLAQSLSALYPSTSDEKRWVDGVLARKKSLGFD